MRVTVLMENCTPSSRLVARHGLSLWIELADGRRTSLTWARTMPSSPTHERSAWT